ncbi:MAG TPA: G1 family glutamic endopeptidase [Gaiellaceae bacterium]|nr:G1 family glutamic endopeptidase [Gaiellaceae bacterium]
MSAGALVVGATAALLFAAPAGAAPLYHDLSASTNWSGYAAQGTTFTDVKGTWVQPAVTCPAGAATYSAFWVGLGGFTGGSGGLEQIGTESDCRFGRPAYSAWYEFLPAPSSPIDMTISAGDTMAAEVSLDGAVITLTLTDVTTGETFSTQAAPDLLDVSSAEWIAEAPSQCGRTGCVSLPLANFGTAQFSGSSTTSDGHTGTISDAAWTATGIQLNGVFSSATPTDLSTDGTSFSVAWVGPPPAPAKKHSAKVKPPKMKARYPSLWRNG